MNVLAKIKVFEVRRVILELKIDPKSFEEEQENTSTKKEREHECPIHVPGRPESRFVGPVDVLERLHKQVSRQDLCDPRRGDPPEDTTYQRIVVYLCLRLL